MRTSGDRSWLRSKKMGEIRDGGFHPPKKLNLKKNNCSIVF